MDLWRRSFAGTEDGHWLSGWLFLRLLGVIYLLGFLSLWTQIIGLVGHDGILPADDYLRAVARYYGAPPYARLPTLCWLSASDGMLRFLCGGGAALSVLLILDVAPLPVLVLLWAFYLSLLSVGREFLSYQWDILLLEAGLLGAFLPRLRLLPRRDKDPVPRVALWLLYWLLFRLMFSSGAAKLLSGDATWRDLLALHYHFETQPLPTLLGWYAHQLPGAVKKLSVVLTFVIEILCPFLILLSRTGRRLAFFPLAGLQGLILLTGNYGFFNWLSLALCLLLLDDATLRRLLPGRLAGPLLHRLGAPAPGRVGRVGPGRAGALCLLCAVVGVVTVSQMVVQSFRTTRLLGPVERVLRVVGPFHSFNRYGLFAVMTITREEIIVEGSNDGARWLPYEFKYKPGDPARPPGLVAPHQPRLDWQMWFAALGSSAQNPWFTAFCVRLLQGDREVLALLEHNPFSYAPPRYVRATRYDYRFTDPAERRRTGAFWRRSELGPYLPVLSLETLREVSGR